MRCSGNFDGTRGNTSFSGLVGSTSRDAKKQQNYLTSSDPHHDMSGEGCQVKVIYHLKTGMDMFRSIFDEG